MAMSLGSTSLVATIRSVAENGDARITLEMTELLQRLGGNRRHRPPHQPFEQRLLGGEVEIDRALGKPCPPRDVLDARGRETIGDEKLQCGIEHFIGPRIGATAEFWPARRFLVFHGAISLRNN